MKNGKTSTTAVLILGTFLLSGWALAQVQASKNIAELRTPDAKIDLFTKRADINGVAYRLYHMLMEAGRRNIQDSARPVHVKSIFTIMNL